MQVVIDIPEKLYNLFVDADIDSFESKDIKYLVQILKEGQVLPEVHGRLIDALTLRLSYMDKFWTALGSEEEEHFDVFGVMDSVIASTPTIVKAFPISKLEGEDD